MQFLNKVFNYYSACISKVSVYSRLQGSVLPPEEEKLFIAKADALNYILGFILSAKDRTYPYMNKGFRGSLSPLLKECFFVYRSKYEESNHNNIIALHRAARELRIPMAQLNSVLNSIDREIKQLTKDQFVDIVRAERVLEVNIATNFFWQKVARYKVPAHIAG